MDRRSFMKTAGAAVLGVPCGACGTSGGAPQGPGEERPACTDRYGDPLPQGALARLGTVRLRQPFVRCVVFSPDGKVLASGGSDNKVVFWDPLTGKALRSFVGPSNPIDTINAVAFSPDGKLLASGYCHSEMRLWQTATGKELRRMKGRQGPTTTIAFSPDGRLLAAGGCRNNAVRLWDMGTGKELHCSQEPQGNQVAFSPDGKILAAVHNPSKIDLWEGPSWTHAGTLEGHKGNIAALAFSPDGKILFTGASDTTVRFWDVATQKERHRLGEVKQPVGAGDFSDPVVQMVVQCLALAPDGKSVAAGRLGGAVHVWDTTTGKELRRWDADPDAIRGIYALAFSPDGKVLASASGDGIRLWDPETGRRRDPFTEPSGCPQHISWSPDGKALAAAYELRTLRLFEVDSRKERLSIRLPPLRLRSHAFSSDGRVLAFVELSGPENRLESIIRLLDVATGKEKGVLREPHRIIEQIAFSPRGDFLTGVGWVVGRGEREFTLWDSVSGKERKRFPALPRAALYDGFGFSPDGRILAMVGREEAISLWDPAAGNKIRSFGRREGPRGLLAFSPDGKTVASAGGERLSAHGIAEATEVILWETATGQERCRLRGHEAQVTAAIFSPDGRLLASAAGEETIRLWDAATGKETGRLTGHRNWVGSLAFSPDGNTLASGSVDTTILFWDPWSVLAQRKRPAGKLGQQRRSGLWTDLASPDAARAYRAIGTLAEHPGEAAPFLHQALGRQAGADPQRLARLIADLDDDRFAVREKASAELAHLGRLAEPALRRTLEGKPSREVQLRLEQLLGKLGDSATDPETIRMLRAVEVLERLGTAEARQVLRDLRAAGEGSLPEEAQAALERLAKRPAAAPHRPAGR